MLRVITIKDRATNEVVAQAQEGTHVFRLEGNWYFDPAAVNMANLRVTERTYVCPHKGTCFWIDLETPAGIQRDAAWVYTVIKPGYERIKDRIGFYGGRSMATIAD